MNLNPISAVTSAAKSLYHAADSGAHAVSSAASATAHVVGDTARGVYHAASTGAHVVARAASNTAHTVGHAATTTARAVGHAAVVTAQEAAEWGKTAAHAVGHVAGQVFATVTNNHKTGNDPIAAAARNDALMAQDVGRNQSDAAKLPEGTRLAGAADLERLGLTDPAMLESGNFRARVYVTGTGEATHYTVAFRGTRFEVMDDWKINAGQALGQPTENYTKALAIGRALADLPEFSISMTGHSMGGGLASAAAIAAGRDANTFNAAGLHANTIAAAQAINAGGQTHRAAQVQAFYVRGEVLSALQDGGDRMAGALLGQAIGGPEGSLIGAALVDAPEAYGTRHAIGNDRPAGRDWKEELPAWRSIKRHDMDYVLHNLPQ